MPAAQSSPVMHWKSVNQARVNVPKFSKPKHSCRSDRESTSRPCVLVYEHE